jgi:hypothetical protein
MKHPRELATTTPSIRIPSNHLEKVEYVFLFGLFLSCATEYRIPSPGTSVSLAEIFSCLFILWRWTVGGMENAQLGRGIRRLIWAFRLFAIYAGILWLFSNNWLDRRGMFADWALAAVLVDCLLRSRWSDWKPVAALFILAALPNAVWGVLQHAMGLGLAPKGLFGWGGGATSSPIMGFFGNSNNLAVYLYWPLLVCAGLVTASLTWRRIPFLALTLLYGLVLYWTVSRSTLLTVGFVVIVLLFLFFFHHRKQFFIAAAIGTVLAALTILSIFLTQPLAWINSILSDRLNLWNAGLQIIFSDKYLLPFGYLAIPPAGLSVWWVPHNIYIISWIEFGVPGFLLLIGLGGFFLYSGWRRYDKLRTHFPTAVLWGGLAGLFLINGMAILYFQEPYSIINFLCVAAIWAAQLREIDASPALGNNDSPSAQVGLQTGKIA